MTGRDTIRLEPGASLAADGVVVGGDIPLLLDGDGAFLRLSAGDRVATARQSTTGSRGDLLAALGSTLAASGSTVLDASRNMELAGSLLLSGALDLQVPRLAFTEQGGTSNGGLALSPSLVESLPLDALSLRATSMIEFLSDTDVSLAGVLEIDTAALLGEGTVSATFTARDVLLKGAASTIPVLAGPAQASLSISAANDILLSGGSWAASGFDRVSLAANRDLVALQDGAATFDGALDLSGQRLTAASGADYAFATTGSLRFGVARAPAREPSSQSIEPGGALSFEARDIAIDGQIVLPSGRASFSAQNDIVFGTDSALAIAGVNSVFDGVAVASPGGGARLVSAAGNVALAPGARIDVSGGSAGADAGRISILAPQGSVDIAGELLGSAGNGYRGGSLKIDASVANSDTFFRLLGTAGFTGDSGLRQRVGDIVLAPDTSVAVHSLDLTADQGSVAFDGVVTAAGLAGGRVTMSARDAVTVNGRIDVGGRGGGDVELDSLGALTVDGSAVIDVADSEGNDIGTVKYRAPADALASVKINGTIQGAATHSLELFNTYDKADGAIDELNVGAFAGNVWFDDAAAIADAEATIKTQVGRGSDDVFRIVPGIEIQSAGGLTLAADWNLANWRFGPGGDTAGVLTLRATGDLLIDRSLSDGFSDLAAFALQLPTEDSWSYRLVAGADLASASPLAVLADTPGAQGSVIVSPGTIPTFGSPDYRMVRTGTGSIDVVASTDIVLGNRASVIYTAGHATDGSLQDGLGNLPYPDGGGDLRMYAGRDIRGAVSNQMVTDWLWRVGSAPGALFEVPVAWTVNFDQFQQNTGALGGGDVTIEAGRDIIELSAVIPSIGRPSADLSTLDLLGGGDLSIRAGNDIRGGSYFVGRGDAEVYADGSVGKSTAIAPILGLGDGSIEVVARRDLQIETTLNPTMIPQGDSQGAGFLYSSYFSTYSPDSAVRLLSVGGDVSTVNDFRSVSPLRNRLTSMSALSSSTERTLTIYPGTLRAVALHGDVNMGGVLSMFPAASGNLDLFANDSLNFEFAQAFQLVMSDADPKLLPSVDKPGDVQLLNLVFSGVRSSFLHAAVPVHTGDNVPARLIALTGDLLFQEGQGDGSFIDLPKPARVIAGRDILDLSLFTQHTALADATTVLAGRDIAYSTPRRATGQIAGSIRNIVVNGPGQLEMLAGREVDLAVSDGIATNGNLLNPVLPQGGANISIVAGVGAGFALDPGAALEDFIDAYLYATDDHEKELVDYIRALTGATLDIEDARVRFAELPVAEQLPLVRDVFFDELRDSGRSAAQAGKTHDDFSRGFAAIETLFPGANPDSEAGQANPYHGDLALLFSRIYTLGGGGISLFAPGGDINVGLATPPVAFGLPKQASQLGLVAQGEGSVEAFLFGDFLVNESRVFAADGGNILVWSTRGDIDAGRGAKTAISAPRPIVTVDQNGNVQSLFPPSLAGSGIQTLATSEGRKPGDVDLFAPRGVVNAGDAGIVAGNLTIAATAVLGADNISVSGVSVGVPVDTGGFAAALTGVSAVASSASNAAQDTVAPTRQAEESATPLADQALGFLDVFITGFGDCDPTKDDCSQRDRERQQEQQ